jgi:hypothetical protein
MNKSSEEFKKTLDLQELKNNLTPNQLAEANERVTEVSQKTSPEFLRGMAEGIAQCFCRLAPISALPLMGGVIASELLPLMAIYVVIKERFPDDN